MTRGILVLWPRHPHVDANGLAAAGRAAAPERDPIDVVIAGGAETATASDLRLDNSADLCRDLGLPGGSSDRAVVDAAYERWGMGFSRRLAGDFVWARWEPRTRELTLVRDHMGIRPLLYAPFRDGFAVASDIRCLQSLPGVDLRLDEFYISMLLSDYWLSREATIHRGIKRLPGGHIAVVTDAGGSIHQAGYWELPSQDLCLQDEREYLARFRQLFLNAVQCRIPEIGGVASELSGGLDSTVVTAAASQAIFPGRKLLALAGSFGEGHYAGGRHDEGQFRRWARADEKIDLVEEPASGMITTEAIRALSVSHGVPLAPFMDLVRLRLWRVAHERGAGVVLDGHDGDMTVNYGFGRLIALARGGHLISLAREFAAAYRKAGRLGFLENAYLLAHPPYYAVWSRFNEPREVQDCLASRSVLERSGFVDAVRSSPTPRMGDVRGEHILDISSAVLAHAIERCEITAMTAGVELRHPFSDRRLVEFAVSLPSHLLFRGRMPRWVERAALVGLGPQEVLWRHDKGRMPNELAYDALNLIHGGEATLFEGAETADLLDMDLVARARSRWIADGDLASCYALYPAALLARWLKESRTSTLT